MSSKVAVATVKIKYKILYSIMVRALFREKKTQNPSSWETSLTKKPHRVSAPG